MKKIFGNQSGYYSLMKPKLKEEIELDESMIQKAKEIAKKIEEDVAYPGQIKIVITRKFESTAVA